MVSGKSTILRLLFRFFDTQQGKVGGKGVGQQGMNAAW